MVALFADLPEAVENTVEIARRCAFRPRKRKPILPRFAEDEVEELRRQAREGLEARLAVDPARRAGRGLPRAARVRARRDRGHGLPRLLPDRRRLHQVGEGARRSRSAPAAARARARLVAYALTITDLDPLRYGLLFERFLNPERISMPDFDIDFCMDRREEVIAYVQERYGRDRVAQIITFGALLSKAAVRDVGRVLQMPYGQVDRLSKLIPMEGVKPVSIEKALAEEPRLREEARRDPQVARLLEIAQAIEGLLRNASTHAAGVVIGDRPLIELVPLYRDPRSDMPATQYNMKWVEEAGLVKFDFLGLKTLTVIQNALDLLRAPRRRRSTSARSRSTTRRPTSSTPRPPRSRCSRWKSRACAPRCASSSRPASRTSSRWSRSTGPGRWRTSRSSATSRTAARSARACTPRSTRSSTRPRASSSTRSR